MVGIVASEVAVLDETSTGVTAVEVDDFELVVYQQKALFSHRFERVGSYLAHCEGYGIRSRGFDVVFEKGLRSVLYLYQHWRSCHEDI